MTTTIAHRTTAYDPPAHLSASDRRRGVEGITRAELAAFRAYMHFGSQKLAAESVGITLATLKNHVAAVLWRLDVDRSIQAAVLIDRWEANR